MDVLIVDDSNIIRMAIKKYLKQYGLRVIGTAGDGQEALELFKKSKPKLVTMDITMPRMDGLKCMEEMLKLAPDTKVLIITALKDTHTGIRALKMGAKGFLAKPFTETLFKEEIELLVS